MHVGHGHCIAPPSPFAESVINQQLPVGVEDGHVSQLGVNAEELEGVVKADHPR